MFESFQPALDEGLNMLYAILVRPLRKVSEGMNYWERMSCNFIFSQAIFADIGTILA